MYLFGGVRRSSFGLSLNFINVPCSNCHLVLPPSLSPSSQTTCTFIMIFAKIAGVVAILAGAASAQDQCNLLPVAIQSLPLKALVGNQTICQKYTPSNSSQYDFVCKLVNLAFTGDYKPLPNLWPAVTNGTYQASGILNPNSVYRDPCYTVTAINLVPYFNGTYKSNNRNGVGFTFTVLSVRD